MPTPLVDPSRDSADRAKRRTRVHVIGDRKARDFEANELQDIQDAHRQHIASSLFRHGGIVRESGGTVMPARAGVATAGITAIASPGSPQGYRIKHSQQYLVRVTVGGPKGTAKLLVTSNGPDNNNGRGFALTTWAGDPLTGTYWYAFGLENIIVAFRHANPNVDFVAGDTWIIQTSQERQIPFIGARAWVAGDPGVGPTTEGISLPQIDLCLHGDIYTVRSSTLLYEPATSGQSTIYVEGLLYRVTAEDDPSLADTLSTDPVAERLEMCTSYQKLDTSEDALPDGAIGRTVVPVYVWDRAKPYTDPRVVRRAMDFPYRVPLDQLPGQIGPDSLVGIDLNQELTGELALRDSEVFGSFVVSGLGVHQSTNTPPVNTQVGLTIDGGVARVNGLRVALAGAELWIDGGTDTEAIGPEPYTFHEGQLDYALKSGRAIIRDGFPIASITRLNAGYVLATVSMNRSTTDDYDTVPNASVSALVQVRNATIGGSSNQTINPYEDGATGSVAQGATSIALASGHGTRFATGGGYVVLEPGEAGKEEKVSYTGVSGDTLTGCSATLYAHSPGAVVRQENFRLATNAIQWVETDPGAEGGVFRGKAPNEPSSYTLDFHQSQQLVEGVGGDFTLIDKDGDGALDTIRFNASPPATNPADSTDFTVEYLIYLKRRDVIFVRQDGTIDVSRGTASRFPVVRPPGGQFLEIAKVLVPPATAPDALVIDETRLQAMSMRELCSLAKVVDDMRHDFVTQKKLNQILGLDATFNVADADAFTSDTKVDWGFSKLGGVGGVDAGVLVTCDPGLNILAEVESFGGGHLRLPRTNYDRPLVPNLTQVPGGLTKLVALRDWYCLSYSEVILLSQGRYSEQRNINSFLAYSPPDPKVVLDPAEDFWIETADVYEVDLTVKRANSTLIGSLMHQLSQDTWSEAQATGRLPKASPFFPGRRVRFDWIMQRIEQVAALYMRQIPVVVRGRHFKSGQNFAEQVTAKFDGKPVALTGIEGTVAGLVAGSVLVSADEYSVGVNPRLVRRGGSFAARFVIPPDVKTGVRTLLVEGNDGSVASALYTSFGIERTIHNIAGVTVLRSPLAQTFAFTDDYMLSRCEVVFADKYVRYSQLDYEAYVAVNNAVPPWDVGDPNLEATVGPYNDPLIVEVREVITPGGYPGPRYYEQVARGWEDIVVGAANPFAFPNLVAQPARTFYAVTFRNQGNEYQVYTATMGRRDLSPTGGDIDVNPNIRPDDAEHRLAGVCLDSLNNDYWESPDPNAPGSTIALRWDLYRASFSTGTPGYLYYDIVQFPEPVAFLFLVTQQYVPEGTDVVWEVSVDNKASWFEVVPFREHALTAPVSSCFVRVRAASTNERRSPMIGATTATLVGSMPKASGEYIEQRVIAHAIDDVDAQCSAKVYVELKKGVEEPRIFLSHAESSGELPIWEECGLGTSDSPAPEEVDLGNGWVSRIYNLTFTVSAGAPFTNRLRSRVRMTGATANARINGPVIGTFGWSLRQDND